MLRGWINTYWPDEAQKKKKRLWTRANHLKELIRKKSLTKNFPAFSDLRYRCDRKKKNLSFWAWTRKYEDRKTILFLVKAISHCCRGDFALAEERLLSFFLLWNDFTHPRKLNFFLLLWWLQCLPLFFLCAL